MRKDLVRKYSRQYPVPTYVVEFLLGRYCASRESGSWQRRTDAEAKAGQLHWRCPGASPGPLATVTLPAPGSGAIDARAHRTGQSRIPYRSPAARRGTQLRGGRCRGQPCSVVDGVPVGWCEGKAKRSDGSALVRALDAKGRPTSRPMAGVDVLRRANQQREIDWSGLPTVTCRRVAPQRRGITAGAER